MARLLSFCVLLVLVPAGVARGAPWRWPVTGEVARSFSVDPARPYAAGQRRGITIAADPGAFVRAACGGRVVFAGAVGRAGPTVSVACRGARATYQGLAVLHVRAGEVVAPGAVIARLSSAGRLRLGARIGPGRYRDPLALLGRERPPLGPAPRAAPPRRAPPARGPRTLVPRPAAPAAVPARPAPATRSPLLAWLGLGLVAVALPAGALVRAGVRRRRRAPAAAPIRAG